MNDFSDNPFNIPNVDKNDIPVLDDIVTPGNTSDDQHNVNTFSTIDPAFLNESDLKEKDSEEKEQPTGESTNEAGIGKIENADIDMSQLTPIIEQIAIRVQQELEARIEETIRYELENSLNQTLQQHKKFIRESINNLLKKRLPDAFNTISTISTISTTPDQSTINFK